MTPVVWDPIKHSPPNLTSERNGMRKVSMNREPKEVPTTTTIVTIKDNTDKEQCYSGVFLCHTQLYVFAEMQLVPRLKKFALINLLQSLKHFKLHRSRIDDLVALLRYVYENTVERSTDSKEKEPLRALLMDFPGFQMDFLMDKKECTDVLLELDGALLQDFLVVVQR